VEALDIIRPKPFSLASYDETWMVMGALSEFAAAAFRAAPVRNASRDNAAARGMGKPPVSGAEDNPRNT
jgi:hypothetical protein